MKYESTIAIASTTAPEVTFTIQRMSFGRRVELTRHVRELTKNVEFLEAGGDVNSRLEAALLLGEVEKLYLKWGLKEIRGLWIDGEEATLEALVAAGPEELCKEIVAAIKRECGLSEEERKN
ncbi:MAG: hypothetical protein KIT09_27700 [Bryobacteraceae bacterium]|nr:hypothetical protein [Bryobacteraceae bacterium]